MVNREARSVAGPAGTARSIHESDANGSVRERVGEVRDFRFGYVGHLDPRLIERARVEVASLDFAELHWVDLGEAAHHFQKGERAEDGVFSACSPDDGGERSRASRCGRCAGNSVTLAQPTPALPTTLCGRHSSAARR